MPFWTRSWTVRPSRSNDRALEAGVTPQTILDDLRHADIGVPTAVMTYGNIAYHMGFERFANRLPPACPGAPARHPPRGSGGVGVSADEAGVEIMLAAPTAPDERLPLIVERARGFVYGVGLLGITGVRPPCASAVEIAGRLKGVTGAALVGVGVGTPEQAVEVSQVSDGVVAGRWSCSACSTTLAW